MYVCASRYWLLSVANWDYDIQNVSTLMPTILGPDPSSSAAVDPITSIVFNILLILYQFAGWKLCLIHWDNRCHRLRENVIQWFLSASHRNYISSTNLGCVVFLWENVKQNLKTDIRHHCMYSARDAQTILWNLVFCFEKWCPIYRTFSSQMRWFTEKHKHFNDKRNMFTGD